MTIEASRQALADLPITATLLAALRETARLQATHYSTQIEGNRLTLAQVQAVLQGGQVPGRARDVREVRHYDQALTEVERLARQADPLTETQIQTLHGLVTTGRRRPTPYRDGQNVIRDHRTGAMVYLPPEAQDVSGLMADLVQWLNQVIARHELPLPIIAALAHYQLATIHPYYDGNGRTARLLTTLILHRHGYGLKGLYALEAYYAEHLQAYYEALAVGGSHNYYLGRAEADVTHFVVYFCIGMAEACTRVRAQAQRLRAQGVLDQTPQLRELTALQRQALTLFVPTRRLTAKELATGLGLASRAASDLCRRWVQEGFLEVAEPSKKARRYQLAPPYEALVAPHLA
jgi:Fic family protein